MSIDVIKYLFADSRNDRNSDDDTDDKWISLNNTLCDYVLP